MRVRTLLSFIHKSTNAGGGSLEIISWSELQQDMKKNRKRTDPRGETVLGKLGTKWPKRAKKATRSSRRTDVEALMEHGLAGSTYSFENSSPKWFVFLRGLGPF